MPSSVLSGQLVSKTPAGSSKQLMSPRRIAAAPILRANARCNDLVDRLPACWSTAAPSFDLVLDKLCFGHRDKMSGCVGHRSKLSEPQKKNDGRVGKCALSRAVNEPSKPSRARINLGKIGHFFIELSQNSKTRANKSSYRVIQHVRKHACLDLMASYFLLCLCDRR